MKAAADPWMKFYPQDWRADEKLRMCSLAARGLWLEMLAIMHRSERYGMLLIGGLAPTDAQLAVQVGASPQEVTTLVGELSAADVFSRTSSGVIYSRRMTRDHRRAQNAKKNGKKGGNPSLKSTGKADGLTPLNEKEKSASDNQEDKPQDNHGVKPIYQKPEARVYSDTNVSGDGEPPPDTDKLFWDNAKTFLRPYVKGDPGSLIGKWSRDFTQPATAEAIAAAQVERAVEPISFIEATLKRRQVVKTDERDAMYAQAARYRGAGSQ